MRIGEVIGNVTLSRSHPSIRGGVWRIVVPLSAEGLRDRSTGRGEPLVMIDEWGAGEGALVAFTESAEAAAPYQPHPKPVDAYCAAILDTVDTELP